MMKLSHVMTVLLAGASVLFISGAESSPHLQAPLFSPLPLQAELKCGLVDGQVVCGKKKSSKHKDDDDDHGKDNDRQHKTGKKKNTDDDAGLSECTIQGPSGGGGCKTGFKRVCEKLKSGKKCCGCVVDKNAKAVEAPKEHCCRADWTDVTRGTTFCGERAEAERLAGLSKMDGRPPDRITCVLKE